MTIRNRKKPVKPKRKTYTNKAIINLFSNPYMGEMDETYDTDVLNFTLDDIHLLFEKTEELLPTVENIKLKIAKIYDWDNTDMISEMVGDWSESDELFEKRIDKYNIKKAEYDAWYEENKSALEEQNKQQAIKKRVTNDIKIAKLEKEIARLKENK